MQQFLTYEQFGAVGDGMTDDMPAIVRTHAAANRQNLPVRARSGARYYISPKAATAEIRTCTDWTGAAFVIDDRDCEDLHTHIFTVPTQEQTFPLALTALTRGQTALENPCGRELYVTVQNETHRDYIRLGLNRNNGFPRQDYLLLHADGSLSSAVSFDFDTVTQATARPVEDTVLTLTGGEFTTLANPQDCTLTPYTATDRNILVTRSNVTVTGLTHRIDGEGETGTAYSGFLRFADCARIRVSDCLFTGHYIYWCTGSAGLPVAMGSYDILCDRCVDVRFVRCRQTTDITDGRYWGLFSSNFCRELVLEDCIFSRFDAHMGVSNCILRNCSFGHQCINIIGNGSFLIENTHVYASRFIHLRDDYGCTFRGDLTVRGCTWHPTDESRTFFFAINTGHHNFGYTCYLPQNILLENFTVDEPDGSTETLLTVFPDYSRTTVSFLQPPAGAAQDFLPVPPQTVTVRGLSPARKVLLCADPALMPDTVFTVE